MAGSDRLIIFSDLDGSLLDHHHYSWAPACEWLSRLKSAQVPVVLNTSKTVAETVVLANRMELGGYPCCVENGAAIHLPETWRNPGEGACITLSGGITHIRTILDTLRHEGAHFVGFSDVDAAQVAKWTGLSVDDAALAQQREASEPLHWLGNNEGLDAFGRGLAAAGLELVRGGRFYHVMPHGVNKGRALEWVCQRYAHITAGIVTSLALGDGGNDVPMLEQADKGVLIRTEGMPLNVRFSFPDRIYRTLAKGPEGWKEGMDYWLGEGGLLIRDISIKM